MLYSVAYSLSYELIKEAGRYHVSGITIYTLLSYIFCGAMVRFTLLSILLAAFVQAGPTPGFFERDYATGRLPDTICKKVEVIVTVLEAYKATPFCSSYLEIPAVTSTTTV